MTELNDAVFNYSVVFDESPSPNTSWATYTKTMPSI